MLPVPEVSDLDLAFPAAPPLPAVQDIPDEFKRNPRNLFVRMADHLFSHGDVATFKDGQHLTLVEGLDPVKVQRAVLCCLRSYAPKHQHKIAGVAFMLSNWFTEDAQPKAPTPAASLAP